MTSTGAESFSANASLALKERLLDLWSLVCFYLLNNFPNPLVIPVKPLIIAATLKIGPKGRIIQDILKDQTPMARIATF